MSETPRRPASAFRRTALVVLAVVLGFLVLRLPSMVHRFDIDDEGLYSLVAAEALKGGHLYSDVVDRKPPLLYGAYALVFTVAGTYNMIAIHVAAALWTLLTMLGLFVAARRLFDARAGMAAAILYGIYSGWGVYTNLAWNGELLANLPVAWALAVALRPSSSRLRPELLGAGALLAIGFLLKQPAATAAVPIGIYLLLPGYRRARGLAFTHSLVQATLLCIGFGAVVAAMLAYLRAHGVLDDALYWAIRHHDMPHGPGDVIFWERLAVAGVFFTLACFPLLAGAAASLVRQGRTVSWDGLAAERTALLLYLATAMVGVSASGRFYLHYFILLLPPLALAAAPVFAGLWSGAAPDGPWPLKRRASAWALAITAVGFFASHIAGLARRDTGSEAARFVREHSASSDRIFVWGELPRIYVEADRRPASRYVCTFPLTGFPYGGSISYEPAYPDTTSRIVPGTWAILDRELAAHQPRYIVDVEATLKPPRYPFSRFPTLARLIDEKYRRVHDARDGVIYERTRP